MTINLTKTEDRKVPEPEPKGRRYALLKFSALIAFAGFMLGGLASHLFKDERSSTSSPHDAFLASNYVTSIDLKRIWIPNQLEPVDLVDECRKDTSMCAFLALNRYGDNVVTPTRFRAAQLSNEWLMNGVEKARFAYCKRGKHSGHSFLIGERPLPENGFQTFYSQINMITKQTGVGPAFLSLDDPRAKALELRTEPYQPPEYANLLPGFYPGAMFRLKDRDLWVILVSKAGKQSLVYINMPILRRLDMNHIPYC